MSHSFKGTRHVRDMYEICTAQVREIRNTDQNQTQKGPEEVRITPS